MKTHIVVATLVAAAMAGINPAHAGESAGAPGTRTDAAPKQEIRLERLTPEYWRVTLDNPPFNIFGPETIPQLNSVITQIETDPKVKVVVFQLPGPDPKRTSYGSFFSFNDPDGNMWLVQEVTTRLPGRI